MLRRRASVMCFAAMFVAAGLSPFALDFCCDVDMHCPPCASVLCWVGQVSDGPHLAAPSIDTFSATVRASPLRFVVERFDGLNSTSNGFLLDGSPPGSNQPLRV